MNDIRIKCAHCKAIQPIKKSDIKTDKKAQVRLKEIEKLVENVPEFVPKKFVPYKKTWKDKINPFFFIPYSATKEGHRSNQEYIEYIHFTYRFKTKALCREATQLIATYWKCKLCGRKNKFEVI